MIYQMYQSHTDLMDPLRWMARHSSAVLGQTLGSGASLGKRSDPEAVGGLSR